MSRATSTSLILLLQRMKVSMKCHCAWLRLAKRPWLKCPSIVIAQLVQRTAVISNSPLHTGHWVGSGYCFCGAIVNLLKVEFQLIKVGLCGHNTTLSFLVNTLIRKINMLINFLKPFGG